MTRKAGAITLSSLRNRLRSNLVVGIESTVRNVRIIFIILNGMSFRPLRAESHDRRKLFVMIFIRSHSSKSTERQLTRYLSDIVQIRMVVITEVRLN